jgi:hypothetical protein
MVVARWAHRRVWVPSPALQPGLVGADAPLWRPRAQVWDRGSGGRHHANHAVSRVEPVPAAVRQRGNS